MNKTSQIMWIAVICVGILGSSIFLSFISEQVVSSDQIPQKVVEEPVFSEQPLQLDSKTESISSDPDSHEKDQKLNLKVSQRETHPLSADEMNIISMDELFTFQSNGGDHYDYNGVKFNKGISMSLGKISNWIWSHYTKSYPAKSDSWPRSSLQLHDTDSADIDGDGLDEIVVIGVGTEYDYIYSTTGRYIRFTPFIDTFDDETNNFSFLQRVELPKYRFTQEQVHKSGFGNPDGFEQFDGRPYFSTLALGDADGSGRSNWLGITLHRTSEDRSGLFKWDWEYVHELVAFYKWSDASHMWLKQTTHKFLKQTDIITYETRYYLSVESVWADVTGNPGGREEYIIATNHQLRMWSPDRELSGKRWQSKVYASHYNYRAIDVALTTGNFDSDKGLEIAILSSERLYVYDWHTTSYSFQKASVSTSHLSQFNQMLATDSDRNGIDDIILIGLDYSTAARWGKTYRYQPEKYGQNWPYDLVWEDGALDYLVAFSSTGDLDCDDHKELILSTHLGVIMLEVLPNGSPDFDTAHSVRSPTDCPILVSNFRNRGMKITYTGNDEEIRYDPQILVAMSAPPTQVGISQAVGNTYTSYGKTVGRTASSTSSIGFSLSSTLGLSLTPNTGGISRGISRSKTWANEFEKTGFQETSLTVATYSAGGYSDNTIIYFQGSYTRYSYIIQDHPIYPELNGLFLNISFPNTPFVYSVSQEYFNKYLRLQSPGIPVIGNETFSHLIGHPETYRSRSDVGAIKSSGLYITPEQQTLTVGQGEQFRSIEISTEKMIGSTLETTKTSLWTSGLEVAIGSIGINFEETHEESESTGYTTTINSECIIEGRVGDISDPVDYCLFNYAWGMYMHHVTHPDVGNTYLTIGYFVEDAIAYYPEYDPTTSVETSSTTPFGSISLILGSLAMIAVLKYRKRVLKWKENKDM